MHTGLRCIVEREPASLHSAAGNVDREPHPIANRDAINLQTGVTAIGAECISFDAVHPESEPLVETQIVDVRGRGRRQNARRCGAECPVEGCMYQCTADALTP